MAYNREDMITWNELAPSLQTILQSYSNGIDDLKSKYQEEHLSMGTLENNLAAMIQQQSEAQAQMQASINQLTQIQNDMKSSIDTLNTTQSQMSTTCSSIESSLNNNMTNIKNTGNSIDSTCKKLDTTTTDLKTTCSSLNSTCNEINNTLGTVESSCRGLSNLCTSLDSTCKTLDNTCKDIKTTLTTMITTLNANSSDTKKAIDDNHAVVQQLLEAIKENTLYGGGSGGGGGTTVTTFNLNDVANGVNEFGVLTATEQKAANALKSDGKTNAEIVEWLRLGRNSTGIPDSTATFDLSEVEGAEEEFGTLTSSEKTAADALKKAGLTDEEVVTWLRESRAAENATFSLSDVEGAEEEFGSLTNAEQTAANALKRAGKTDEEILAWLRTSRGAGSDAVFNLSDVVGAVDEFGSLTEEEQTLANAKKRAGQSDAQIIAWLRDYRASTADVVFRLSDVAGAVAEFGSLTEEEQILANAKKKEGQSNSQIIEWLREYRRSQGTDDSDFHLSDVPGAVAEFGTLTEDEQILANNYKKNGYTNDQIIEWLRNYRNPSASDPVFNLSDVVGAVDEFGSLTEDEQVIANAYKKNGKTDAEIIAWLREYREKMKEEDNTFKLSDTPGAEAEFGALTEEEQIAANALKASGKTDAEIISWLRTTRTPETPSDEDISSYSDVIAGSTALRVHEKDIAPHNNLKSSSLMMHRVGTSYEVGDTVFLGELPDYMVMYATTNGVTAYSRPNFKLLLGSADDASAVSESVLSTAEADKIKAKLNTAASTTVNAKILDLHRRVYDHQYDQDAHDLTSTSRYTHKINHAYTKKGRRIFAHGLEPHMMLEVFQTGVTGEIAPGIAGNKVIPKYVAPTLTAENQASVLSDIRQSINDHSVSTSAHKADFTDFLFETTASRFQYVKIGNSCRLCQVAS